MQQPTRALENANQIKTKIAKNQSEHGKGLLCNSLLMHLEDMDYETTSGGELLMTDMALEMLCLLMLNEDLLVIELSLAVEAPHFRNSLLLLLSHGARKIGILSSLEEGADLCTKIGRA